MSIIQPKVKNSQSISIEEHHMRLDMLEKAVGFYFTAHNKPIQQQILVMITASMPAAKHLTDNGVLIELRRHSCHVAPKKGSENGLCPYCQADLASTGKVVSAEINFKETTLIWLCGCGKYSQTKERGRY